MATLSMARVSSTLVLNCVSIISAPVHIIRIVGAFRFTEYQVKFDAERPEKNAID